MHIIKKNFLFISISIVWFILAILVLNNSIDQISDFGVYFRCGLSTTLSIEEQQKSCASAYLPGLTETFYQRSLLYTRILGSLDILSLNYLKVFNLALTLASFLVLLFTFSKKSFFVLAILFFSPEVLLSLALASHDLPGLFIYASALSLLKLSFQTSSLHKWIAISVLCGLILFQLEFSRSLGLFCIGALILFSISHYRTPEIRKNLIVILIGFFIGSLTIGKLALTPNSNRQDPLALLARLNILDYGNFSIEPTWLKEIYPILPSNLKKEWSSKKIFTELTFDPVRTFKVAATKTKTLFSSDGVLSFVDSNAKLNADTYFVSDKSARFKNTRFWRFYSSIYRMMLVPILVYLMFIALFSKRGSAAGRFFFFLSVILWMFLVSLGEVQSRYSIWILLPLLLGGYEYRRSKDSIPSFQNIYLVSAGVIVTFFFSLTLFDGFRLAEMRWTKADSSGFIQTDIKPGDLLRACLPSKGTLYVPVFNYDHAMIKKISSPRAGCLDIQFTINETKDFKKFGYSLFVERYSPSN